MTKFFDLDRDANSVREHFEACVLELLLPLVAAVLLLQSACKIPEPYCWVRLSKI